MIERDKQRAVAVLAGQMSLLQNQLNVLDAEVKQTTEDVKLHHLTGRLNLNFLAAHRRYLISMQRKAMGVVQQMAQLQVKVDEAQKALQSAAVQRKIMEKLKEKQQARWKEEVDRKELAQQDEIAMQLSYANHVEDLEAGA
jgi:flagellar export protein FliJ